MNDDWIRLALTKTVVRRALRYAAIVGVILIAINHGDALLRGRLEAGRLLKMALTVLVPYCVSTFSSVEALRGFNRSMAEASERTEG